MSIMETKALKIVGSNKNIDNIPLDDVKGMLFRSVMPFSTTFDKEDEMIEIYKALHELSMSNGGALLVVQMPPDDEAARLTGGHILSQEYRELGFEVINPIIDGFSPETKPLLLNALKAAENSLRSGRVVVSHCHSGLGRAGVFLTLLTKIFRADDDVNNTIDWLRENVNSKMLEKQNAVDYCRDF